MTEWFRPTEIVSFLRFGEWAPYASAHARRRSRRQGACLSRRHTQFAEREPTKVFRDLAETPGARSGGRWLGRLPELEESPAEALACISENRVSWRRVLDVLRDYLRADETFAIAGRVRREDLLVHFALMQFPGAPKYRHLPRSIQTDIKTFLTGHSAALEEGRRLLFAAGDRDGVHHDIEAAIVDRLGGMRRDRRAHAVAGSGCLDDRRFASSAPGPAGVMI